MRSSFESTKTPLHELLERAHSGKLQLPDFQRDWVWDDERIRSLLASVSLCFPIGAVMLLETGGTGVRLASRPLNGVPGEAQLVEAESLILDGQQRLTALYQALWRQCAVHTRDLKNKPIRRWYYFDMKKAVNDGEDRMDAILSIPEDKVVRSAFGHGILVDLRKPELEYAADLFPANHVFDSAIWRQEYNQYWNYAREKIQLYDQFERDVIKRVEQYLLPVIELKRETPKEAVCVVFERVNTGGVELNVFDLLTASFAADDFSLRDEWAEHERNLRTQYRVLANLKNDEFLQAMALLVTQERRRLGTECSIGCKRKDILSLTVSDWKAWANRVHEGFALAARFLHSQKIFRAQDLPYSTQLVPLAAILAELGREGEIEGARQKIARWFWCGVLGEVYAGALESRFARDLPEVTAMVRGEPIEPSTIQESNFAASRLLTLRSRKSAAYKGLYALLMRDGTRDLLTGRTIEEQTFFDDAVDIHHIFPEAWCDKNDIQPRIYNSIVNKTPLAARTNRKIGGRAPSMYLPAIEREAGIQPEQMDDILRSHCINPQLLRSDRFWDFLAARAEELLRRIEGVTGKRIMRERTLFQPEQVLHESIDDSD